MAVPPLTWKLKAVAIFVPPLSLTTVFLTMRDPGMNPLVNVQIVSRPDWIVKLETVGLANVPVAVGGADCKAHDAPLRA